MANRKINTTNHNLQPHQVKSTPIYFIDELIIWKMNLLVVAATSIKFKSALLHR